MDDPLQRLLVSAKEVNRELLASLLHRWVAIDQETGAIMPTAEWDQLDARRKALIYLLARKAALALAIDIGGEAAGARTVELATGMKGGTVRRVLRELFNERLVAQDSDAGYVVPSYALEKVRAMFQE